MDEFERAGQILRFPGKASQDLAAIEYWHMKFSDIRAQLTKIDDELTRQRHLLEQIKAIAEKFK